MPREPKWHGHPARAVTPPSCRLTGAADSSALISGVGWKPALRNTTCRASSPALRPARQRRTDCTGAPRRAQILSHRGGAVNPYHPGVNRTPACAKPPGPGRNPNEGFFPLSLVCGLGGRGDSAFLREGDYAPSCYLLFNVPQVFILRASVGASSLLACRGCAGPACSTDSSLSPSLCCLGARAWKQTIRFRIGGSEATAALAGQTSPGCWRAWLEWPAQGRGPMTLR